MATISSIPATILAQNPAANALEKPETWILAGLVVAVLLMGAGAISMADRWRKRQNREIDPTESLSSFRELYERGELSKEEYDRVKTRIANAAVKQMGLKKPAAKPATPPEEPKATGLPPEPTTPPESPTPPAQPG